MKEEKVDLETALAEFDRFAEAWRIDTFVDMMTDKEEEDFTSLKRKIVLEIRRGSAVVLENGDIQYQLYKPFETSGGEITLSELHLKRPAGRHWDAMDGIGANKSIKMMMNFYAAVLGKVPATLKKLDGVDMRMIQTVYSLFLG